MTERREAGTGQEIEALRAEFSDLLSSRLQVIEQLWRGLTCEEWDEEKVRQLKRAVHTLSGSASTFGFPALGQIALSLEGQLQPWCETEAGIPAGEELQDLAALIDELRGSASLPRTTLRDSALTLGCDLRQGCLVYLVEDDATLASELQQQLGSFGYEVEVFGRCHRVVEAVAERRPDALIVDIVLTEGDEAGIDLVRQLRRQFDLQVPMLFITARTDVQARLAAVRCGCDAYLAKPLDVIALVDRLNQLMRPKGAESYRILIVDDDVTLSRYYAQVLEQAGMKVSVLNEPLGIIEQLDRGLPDLILMDINMPQCSGTELVKILRQFDRYTGLSIVYLSSESELERQLAALRFGGDDFLTKPLSDAHLLAAVAMRAERSRRLRALMNQDSLTGLVSHVALKERLASELELARHYGAELAFAMLDLDSFKQVNDWYGHLVGDSVLRTLADLLRQRVRQCDVVGRYGGEEFGIVLPNCGLQDAVGLVERLRRAFSRIGFYPEDERVTVTFSSGVASTQEPMSVEGLIARADQALYRAKTEGGNRVLPAVPE